MSIPIIRWGRRVIFCARGGPEKRQTWYLGRLAETHFPTRWTRTRILSLATISLLCSAARWDWRIVTHRPASKITGRLAGRP